MYHVLQAGLQRCTLQHHSVSSTDCGSLDPKTGDHQYLEASAHVEDAVHGCDVRQECVAKPLA